MDYINYAIELLVDYVDYALELLIALFICIVIIKVYIEVAYRIGERLGFGRFFMYLWQKIRKQ